MTATEPASLDAILANATPVEAEPFDVEFHLDILSDVFSVEAALDASREKIARHVNTERVRTEDARRWVDRLQGECADKDRRIKEALRWLEMAESYSVGEDCSAAIADAMAALRGES